MSEQSTFSTFEEATSEQIRQGLPVSQNKAKEKTYYSKPVTNYFRGREVVSNIIYSIDQFNPGPMKYRIYSVEGSSKVVEYAEYQHVKDNIKWFDSEGDARQASYQAKLTINDLGQVIEKKKKAVKAEISEE